MSKDTASVRRTGTDISNTDDTTVSDTGTVNNETVEFCGKNKTATVSFVIRDANFQPMPSGTAVSISITPGSTVGTTSLTVPNTIDDRRAGNTFSFAVKGPSGDEVDAGFLELKITVPGVPLVQIIQFPVVYQPGPPVLAFTGNCVP
jgi:hypothetical protein